MILRGGGLGDTLLALPAARALEQCFSPCRIEWVGNPAFLPILPLGLRVGCLRSADAPEVSILRRKDANREEILRAFSRESPCDILVAWTPGESAFEENAKALANRVLRADPHPPKTSPPVHATDYLLRTLEPFGVKGPTDDLGASEIRPNAETTDEARRLLNGLGIDADIPYFVVHPGSGGRWKAWPASSFVRLGEHLADEGEIVWVGGPADDDVLKEIRRLSRGGSLNLIESPPLPALADLLSSARGFVGSDSGVTHLAAACGAPTVALFGPTDPAVWGPRGKRVVILRRNANCRSCRSGESSGHTCLAAIDAEEVLEAVLGFDP